MAEGKQLQLRVNMKDVDFVRDMDGLTNATEQMGWPRDEHGKVDVTALKDYHKKDSGMRILPFKVRLRNLSMCLRTLNGSQVTCARSAASIPGISAQASFTVTERNLRYV